MCIHSCLDSLFHILLIWNTTCHSSTLFSNIYSSNMHICNFTNQNTLTHILHGIFYYVRKKKYGRSTTFQHSTQKTSNVGTYLGGFLCVYLATYLTIQYKIMTKYFTKISCMSSFHYAHLQECDTTCTQ